MNFDLGNPQMHEVIFKEKNFHQSTYALILRYYRKRFDI